MASQKQELIELIEDKAKEIEKSLSAIRVLLDQLKEI